MVMTYIFLGFFILFFVGIIVNLTFDITKQWGCANYAKHTGQKWEWVDYDGCYMQDPLYGTDLFHDKKFIEHQL